MMLDRLVCILISLACANGLFVPAADGNIQYIGRVDQSQSTVTRFGWSSVRIIASFSQSSSISVMLQDQPVRSSYYGNSLYYDVYIDGTLVKELNSSSTAPSLYPLAQGLSLSQHSVEIVRRVEAAYGISGFAGFVLSSGGILLRPPIRPNKRIEFIGDSITCGWGILGIAPCTDQPQLEDSERTWAVNAAKAVGADYSLVSWSGQGMVRHYGCPNITCSDSMPYYYPRTMGLDAAPLWNFSSWIPQAVVINLGTNDYGTQPYPPTNVFVQGYTAFVQNQILPAYGKTVTVFAACFFSGPMCDNVEAAYNNLKSVGVDTVFVSFANIYVPNATGCDGHPNVPLQAAWANYLSPIIKKTMGW